MGLTTLDNYRLEKTARLLVSDLRETEQKAVTENIWHEVQFYPDSNMYRITRAGTRLTDVHLDSGVKLINREFDISFYPTGTPSGGATVILGNQRGKQVRVIIAPVTGRVRLSQ